MSNLGWLFWVDYFKDLNYQAMIDDIDSNNEDIIKQKHNQLIEASEYDISLQTDSLGNRLFTGITQYPGLLIGSGYIHELPDIKSQPILGFFFDYTTGLPIIPSSSIKGVLRSAFENREYILELLEEINPTVWELDDISKIEIDIFGQKSDSDSVSAGKDIFFDAVIVSASGKILGDDYITPHGDGITEEPNPLHFIKVMPNVKFRFDFELHDSKIGKKILSSEDKLKLFMSIIEDLGVGAKSSVGYGYFEDLKIEKSKDEIEAEKEAYIKEQYIDAMESNSIEKLEQFMNNYPNRYKDDIESKIHELKEKEKFKEIDEKWGRLDKSNPLHLKEFKKKWESVSYAQKYIEEIDKLLNTKNTFSSVEFDKIDEITDYKELERFIKRVSNSIKDFDDTQKDKIEEALRRVSKLPKRKKFNFALFNNILGKERTNTIVDDLGLR